MCFRQSSAKIIICTELQDAVYLMFCIYIYPVLCPAGVLLRERADVSGVVAARGQVLNASIYLGRHHRVSHPCLYRWAPEATVPDAGWPGGDARGSGCPHYSPPLPGIIIKTYLHCMPISECLCVLVTESK